MSEERSEGPGARDGAEDGERDRFADLGRGTEVGAGAGRPGSGAEAGADRSEAGAEAGADRRGAGAGGQRRDPGADTGPAPAGRSAADQLAELDVTRPEPRPPAAPAPARIGRRYGWVVGVAFSALIIYVGLTALSNVGHRGQGSVRGLPPGAVLPDFAAPLATGGLDGDADVRPSSGGTNQAGRRPACQVRSADVVNICALRRRPTVISFAVTKGADCLTVFDEIERVRRSFPRVSFVGVVSGEPRRVVAGLVRQHGWTFPVAVDRDGAVVNLYRVGVCPTTTLAYAGGRVRATELGRLSEERLRRAVRGLVAGAP